jgi:hypothetical protein
MTPKKSHYRTNGNMNKSEEKVQLSNGMLIPANTTTMEDSLEFRPERFLESEGGADVDVRGGDLRLAPFVLSVGFALART